MTHNCFDINDKVTLIGDSDKIGKVVGAVRSGMSSSKQNFIPWSYNIA